MSTHSGVYIFCAIQEKEPKKFGSVHFNGKKSGVYTNHYKDVAIVAAKVTGEVLPSRNNLMAHKQTISKIMNEYSLIPFSFGNVLHSKNDVLLITERLYEEFEKLFPLLENKIEVDLKVIAKKEWLEHEIKKDPVLNEWKSSKKEITDPANFYEQIQLGEHAQKFVLNLEKEVEMKIYASLLELAEAGKQNDTTPGKTLLNAAFLVNTKNEGAFDKRVNDLYELWKDKAEFKYTGPWPAYNFVNIRLRIEGNI